MNLNTNNVWEENIGSVKTELVEGRGILPEFRRLACEAPNGSRLPTSAIRAMRRRASAGIPSRASDR